MNQKGQASSVFQLLIAAIVAIVILAILMSVLNLIGPLGGTNPQDDSKSLMNSAYSSPGSPQSKVTTFTKEHRVINASTLAKTASAGMSERNICLSTGYFGEAHSVSFEGEAQGGFASAISYLGPSDQKATIVAICDDGTSIMTDTDGSKFKSFFKTGNTWFSECDSAITSDNREDETFCFIALKPA